MNKAGEENDGFLTSSRSHSWTHSPAHGQDHGQDPGQDPLLAPSPDPMCPRLFSMFFIVPSNFFSEKGKNLVQRASKSKKRLTQNTSRRALRPTKFHLLTAENSLKIKGRSATNLTRESVQNSSKTRNRSYLSGLVKMRYG